MALLHPNTRTLPWLYYTLPWLHVAQLDSTTLYHGSTWQHVTLLHCAMTLLDPNTCHIALTLLLSILGLLGSTLLYYTLHGSIWQHVTLLHCAMALLYPTTRHLASTGVYLTLLHSIMALRDWLQYTMSLLGSTRLYHTLRWLHLVPLDYTTLYQGSNWLYLTLIHSSMTLSYLTLL